MSSPSQQLSPKESQSTPLPKVRVGPFSGAERSVLRSLAQLPGPPGLPILGNSFDLRPSRSVEIFERWAREHGPLCRVKFPRGNLLLVTQPEWGEQLLRARPGALRRWSGIEPVFAELGARGVFSEEGEAWRAQRRLVMEALSQRHLRGFFPTLKRVTQRLQRHWERAASDGRVIEPTVDLMRFTTDVTVSLAFSTDMNSIEDAEQQLQKNLSLVFPAIGNRLNSLFPYWRYLELPKDRRLSRALAEIKKIQVELLAAARARVETKQAQAGDTPDEEIEASDMLEAMLLARDEQGAHYSDDALYGNMLTMLLAGEDTTAFGLAWALHFLADRPDIVEKMRQEADERMGHTSVLDDLATAKPLAYIDGVANEALRLKSPAPAAPLETLKELAIGDVYVPPGCAVQVMTRIPAVSEANFSSPQLFAPERWLPSSGFARHEPRVNIPFGSGPRICPGRTLALLEMRMVLSMLAKNFDIQRVGEASQVLERTAFVLTPVGIRVKLTPRPG